MEAGIYQATMDPLLGHNDSPKLHLGGVANFEACLQVEGSLKIQNASKLQFHGCHNNVSNGGGAGLNGGEDDGVENNGGGVR